jgi:hypothetical protein
VTRLALCLLPLLALRAAADGDSSPEMAAIQAEFDEMTKGGQGKAEAADRIARMTPFPAEILSGFLVETKELRYRECIVLACEYAGAASKPAVLAVAQMLFVPDFVLKTGAMAALRACGPDAIAAAPALLKVMMSNDKILTGSAAELLLYGMGDAGREALKSAISDPDEQAATKAMESLARSINFYRAGPWALLAEVIAKEKDPLKRLSAARNAHLCTYEPGADALVPALCTALLEDEDPAVRAACAVSLPEPASQNPDLREMAVESLEASAKEDGDERVKAASAEAAKALSPRR